MFDAPEYESYIALCRELRLEHIFGQADWAFVEDPESESGGVVTTRLIFEGERAGDTVVWLPRLDQWLAMLEEAGVAMVQFVSRPLYRNPGYQIIAIAPGQEPPMPLQALTREEAAARLWMAVTKR